MKISYREEIYQLKPEYEFELQEYFANREFNHFFIESSPKELESVYLKIYFLDTETNPFSDYLKSIHANLIKQQTLKELDWLKAWIENLEAFEVCDGIWIDPFPHKPLLEVKGAKKVFKIIPGTAFGTGLHATTQLAAKQMQELNFNDKVITDVGCGTGILALLASHFGASETYCYDDDPMAIMKAKETLEMNKVTVTDCDTADLLANLPNIKVDIVIANIICEVLIMLLEQDAFKNCLKEDSLVVFSGVSNNKREHMESHIEKHKFKILKHLNQGDWNSYLLSLA